MSKKATVAIRGSDGAVLVWDGLGAGYARRYSSVAECIKFGCDLLYIEAYEST